MNALCIGNVTLKHGLVLGPMAGYTSPGFRLLARHYGAALCYTDMTMAGYVLKPDDGGPRYPRLVEGDRPVGVQLCGRDPDELARAARRCQDMGFDLVDLNLACPAPKVVRKGYGGALLGKPDEALRFVDAMRRAVDVPMTIKIRTGYRHGNDTFLDVARRAVDAGVDAIAFHPRSVDQRYTGQADWSKIKQLVDAVGVPVLGSGDVHGPEDVAAMFDQTGCQGVTIARGALGAPWVFREALALLTTGRLPAPTPRAERVWALRRHFQLLCECMDMWYAVRLMRRAAGHYGRRLHAGARFRQAIAYFQSPEQFEDLLEQTFHAELAELPADGAPPREP